VKAHVRKWGNSLAVRIPKAYANDLGLESDSVVELAVEDGGLVVRPAIAPEYRLDELLSRVTEANIHGEQEYGDAVGGEEW
jgi:antitoxin MazE